MKRTIELFQERDFGAVFSDTFKFIRQNFKLLFPALLIGAGPFFLLNGFSLGMYLKEYLGLFGGMESGTTIDDFSSFGGILMWVLIMYGFTILSYIMLFTVTSQYFISYSKDRDNMPNYLGIVRKSLKLLPAVILGTIVVGLMVTFGTIALIIPGIYLAVSTCFVVFIMVFERKGLGDAISRSFEIIKGNWWWTFLILIVMYFLVSIINNIFQMPVIILSTLGFFNEISGSGSNSKLVDVLTIVLSSLGGLAAGLTQSIIIVAVAFQYFNLVEKKEGVGFFKRIEELDERIEDLA